jgi:hypothetical protein
VPRARSALDALGIQARVWKTDHEPRYAITASIPLDDPAQTGQDSMLYAESQNIHSYRLAWTKRCRIGERRVSGRSAVARSVAASTRRTASPNSWEAYLSIQRW